MISWKERLFDDSGLNQMVALFQCHVRILEKNRCWLFWVCFIRSWSPKSCLLSAFFFPDSKWHNLREHAKMASRYKYVYQQTRKKQARTCPPVFFLCSMPTFIQDTFTWTTATNSFCPPPPTRLQGNQTSMAIRPCNNSSCKPFFHMYKKKNIHHCINQAKYLLHKIFLMYNGLIKPAI